MDRPFSRGDKGDRNKNIDEGRQKRDPSFLEILIEGREKGNGLKKVGGNSEEDPDIICLGESHSEDKHRQAIGEFLKKAANPGDVVLFEGYVAEEELYHGTLGHTIGVRTLLKAYGWDNMELVNKMYCKADEGRNLEKQLQELPENSREYQEKSLQLDAIKNEIRDLAKKRNISMRDTINEMKKKHSGQRIFVIAGDDHFSDEMLGEIGLEDKKYIILKPEYEEYEHEIDKKANRYYGGGYE